MTSVRVEAKGRNGSHPQLPFPERFLAEHGVRLGRRPDIPEEGIQLYPPPGVIRGLVGIFEEEMPAVLVFLGVISQPKAEIPFWRYDSLSQARRNGLLLRELRGLTEQGKLSEEDATMEDSEEPESYLAKFSGPTNIGGVSIEVVMRCKPGGEDVADLERITLIAMQEDRKQ